MKEYAGEFFAGKFNGVGMVEFNDGNRFYGSFLGGAANGLGIFERRDEIVTGIWQQNYLCQYL